MCWQLLRVTQTRHSLSLTARVFLTSGKDRGDLTAGRVVIVNATDLRPARLPLRAALIVRLFRRERGDDLFEARIAAERVPEREQF
jgi:hypothetical protein